jgi:hypothetical protein
MSSITNAQNLITNVFRPVYVYDGTLQTFTPRLEMSNVDTYIGNEVRVFRDQVGDQSNNVYVGSNAGNSYSNINGCSDVTAVGALAGSTISNVSNSVYLGYSAGYASQNANAVIAIGVNAFGGGTSNIVIGNGPGSNVGDSNILIGHGITTFPTPTSNKLQIGKLVYGDFSNKWVGIGTTNQYNPNVQLDVSGGLFISGKMGIQMSPSNSLNVNGATQSTSGFFSSAGTSLIPNGSSALVGTLQYGTMIFSAQDTGSLSNYYNHTVFVPDIAGGISPLNVSGTSNGYITMSNSGSNIYVNNTNTVPHTVAWSITIFPLRP